MMENNELMATDEIIELNNDYDEPVDYELTDCSGGGKGKLVVGAAVVGGVALIGGYIYHKCKDKLEERKINSLRKKGYVIFKEDEVEVQEIEEEVVEPETTE